MSTDQQQLKLIHPVDLIVTVLILCFCAWLLYITGTFEEVSDIFAQDIQPSFFPRLLLWFIIMLTLVLPIEHRLLSNAAKLNKGREKPIPFMVYFTIGLLLALVLAKPWLGTYLTLVGVCILLPPLWGERRWVLIIPYAIIFPALITLLFTQVLKVYFEPGIFDLGFR